MKMVALFGGINLEVYGRPVSPYSPEEIARQPHLDFNMFYDKAIAGEFCIIKYTRSILNKGLQQKGKYIFGDDDGKLSRAKAEGHPLIEKLDDEFRRISTSCIDNRNWVYHRLAGEWFHCPFLAHLPAVCRPEIVETSSAVRNELQHLIPQVSLSDGAANSGHMRTADIQSHQYNQVSYNDENHNRSMNSPNLMDNQEAFSSDFNIGSQKCTSRPNPRKNSRNNYHSIVCKGA